MKLEMFLYSSKKVYQLDQLAIKQDRRSSKQLMARAGAAVWASLQQELTDLRDVTLFAGAGNNGGDAFCIACLALQQRINVKLFFIGERERQSEASKHFANRFVEAGGVIRDWDDNLPDSDVIIDGLLGIGIQRDLDSRWQNLVKTINSSDAYRVAIDIPSGLNADTGVAMPCAVKADLTVSFIGRKQGCYLADGPDYCGKRVFDDLGVSSGVYQQVDPDIDVLSDQSVSLPVRNNNSYKNQFGHVLVIGGARNMSGACRLAGLAALRTGAGLVSICVHSDNYQPSVASSPDLMVYSWDEIDKALELASVVAIGPGLGHSSQARDLMTRVKSVGTPMVIDADALQQDFLVDLDTRQAVLTPHPGEAARLIGSTSRDIQQNRLSILNQLCDRWPHVSILKGAGTLVGVSGQIASLCRHGHAGMAVAGMGDVLTGITAGLIAQGLEPLDAARLAVAIHARAAEAYSNTAHPHSLIASDIVNLIGSVLPRF